MMHISARSLSNSDESDDSDDNVPKSLSLSVDPQHSEETAMILTMTATTLSNTACHITPTGFRA